MIRKPVISGWDGYSIQSAHCKTALFRIRIGLFFLSPDPDRPKIRIRSGKIPIRIHKKNAKKTESTSKTNVYIKFSTLNNIHFGKVPPKPNQKNIN